MTVTPHKGDVRITCVYMVRQSRGSYVGHPLLSLELTTPKDKYKSFDAVIHIQEGTHTVQNPASQAVLNRMQVALHATC